MTDQPGSHGFDDILAHFAEEPKFFGAVTPPIFQNSLFVFDKVEDLLGTFGGSPREQPYVYSKVSNPTVDILQRKIAALEGTEAAIVTGGGMGAIAIALGEELKAGSHVIMVSTSYFPARAYLKHLEKFGVTHTLVDGETVAEVEAAIRPETSAIYLESPSSMLFRFQDVKGITKLAKERGITTLIDNTYATPLFMRPIEHGVDVVIHSGSKYFSGHSDINSGVVCASGERVDRILTNQVSFYSNLIHPFSAWLMLRGLRTLRVRVERHEKTANEVASWVETRPEVVRVNHVSLATFPQRERYLELMTGSTGLFSFEPKAQEKEKVFAFCNALKIYQRGVSWGGFESLVIPAHVIDPADGRSKWVIRLFCGLEDAQELIKDVEAGLGCLT